MRSPDIDHLQAGEGERSLFRFEPEISDDLLSLCEAIIDTLEFLCPISRLARFVQLFVNGQQYGLGRCQLLVDLHQSFT